jgi:hypothetical protein
MLEGKFRTAFDERELAEDVAALDNVDSVEEPKEIEDMAKISLDIKELEITIKKAEDLQSKFENDPTKKAAYDLIQHDYLEDKREELATKKEKLKKLEKENGFTVIEEV